MRPEVEFVHPSGKEFPLDPPITDEEKQWWRVKRRDLVRRVILRQGLPMFLVFTIGGILAKPDKVLTVRTLWFFPVMLGLAALQTWITVRLQERNQRDGEVRWQRIRETLAGGDQAGDVLGGRET